MAEYNTSNLTPGVKVRLQELKNHLKLKSESMVVGYLLALYDTSYDKLTVKQHEKCVDTAEALNRQEVIK